MQVSQLRSLKNAFSQLKDRSIIRVEGRDAFKFLQGLTTNELTLLHRRPFTSIYTNVLNVQGRVAYDVLISPSPDSNMTTTTTNTPQHYDYLLDCDSRIVGDIQQHFMKYKMRNKLTMTDLSDKYKVWSVFGKSVIYSALPNVQPETSELTVQFDEPQPTLQVSGVIQEWWKNRKDGLLVMDPRYDKLGARMILPQSETPNLPSEFTEVPNSLYNIYRLQFGVPQGPEEIQKDSALPLEVNTEQLNGVHFHKGCYIGQELVARTHYSGLIRKRLFSFVVTQDPSSPVSPDDLTPGDNLFAPLILDNMTVPAPAKGSVLSLSNPSSSSSSSVSAARDLKPGKVVSIPPPESPISSVGIAMIRLENLKFKTKEVGKPWSATSNNKSKTTVKVELFSPIGERERKREAVESKGQKK